MEEVDLDAPQGIKTLKSVILAGGLSFSDCVEKSDLVARAKEAQSALKAGAAANPPSAPPAEEAGSRTLGQYECLVAGFDGRKLDGIIVVLHGFGASNTDFVQLQHLAASSVPDKKFAWVFPQAPVSANALGAAAWWDIDVARWMASMTGGEAGLARLIRDKPTGLDDCRKKLAALMDAARAMAVESHPENAGAELVLGGFSQGAMTAMDLALNLPEQHVVRHVMMFSGAPIVVDEWAQALRGRGSQMRVLLTHGKADMVLPFQASAWVNDLLTSNGVNVRYETHQGGHELGGQPIFQAFAAFLGQIQRPLD